MKLNQRHKAILNHRLDSGVIPGVLADTPELGIDEATAEAACESLRAIVEEGALDFAKLSPAQLAVLQDCMDGSTYFADSEDAVASGQLSRGALLSDHKAAKQLEDAFNLATGNDVEFVRF